MSIIGICCESSVQLVCKIFVYVCCRMHPVKPQHSTQIEYIYYFMSHRSLQFKCGNPKISVSVHLQDKSTETQQSIRRSFFVCLFFLWQSPKQMSWLPPTAPCSQPPWTRRLCYTQACTHTHRDPCSSVSHTPLIAHIKRIPSRHSCIKQPGSWMYACAVIGGL